jgi:nucleoid-associated protein YgaU
MDVTLQRLELYGKGQPYTVNSGDTWCNLANRFYGNPNLWWAIASANGIEDPTLEPGPGTVILIPAYTDVLEVIER